MDMITLALAKKFTKKYVEEKGIKFSVDVVEELPAVGREGVIYFKPNSSSSLENIFDEYMYINNKWEKIGTTEIDLSDYARKEEIPTNISELENDAGYVKDTDYATGNKAGVIKAAQWSNISVDGNGVVYIGTKTFQQYEESNIPIAINKGTLENVIVGKELVSKTQMEEYINSLDGNEISY